MIVILAEETVSSDEISSEQINRIRLDCRNSYRTAINPIRARCDFEDPYFNFLKLLVLCVARKADPKMFSLLLLSFPTLKDEGKTEAASSGTEFSSFFILFHHFVEFHVHFLFASFRSARFLPFLDSTVCFFNKES